MHRIFLLLFTVLILVNCSGKLSQSVIDTRTTHFTWHSKLVKDSFDIYISLPDNYDSTNTNYPVLYYMDANLKSGKGFRQALLDYRNNGKQINAIAIGIGHFRNYRELRRRDLITPFVKSGDSLVSDEDNFGHCEEFYQFLQQELIPHIEKNYRCDSSNRSILGHSLGGLFAFYCLFKKEHIFRNHVALSPALWINYGNIYDFEKKYYAHSKSLNARLWLCTGTRETLNKILDGGRDMKAHLDKRKYEQLDFRYKEFEGETHNSEVPKAFEMILPELILK
jgi:predicted alpha/beta superfamily hydrolase